MICFPLDNTRYEAKEMGAYLCTRTRGVFSADDNLAVSPGTEGLSVMVSPGIAWFKWSEYWGTAAVQEKSLTLKLDAADGALDRLDVVVGRLDKVGNLADISIRKGAFSSAPAITDPVRDESADEIYLSSVRVRAGAVSITAEDITDMRLNEEYCGLMRDGVTGIPTAQLQEQAQELIDHLNEEINGIEQGSEVMLKTVYDPDGTGIPVERGGTGASTAEQARANLGALPATGFSTDEVAIGQTWIDGKPLFKRTFEIDLQGKYFSFDTGIPAGSLDTVFIGAESFCVYVDASIGNAQTIYPISAVYSENETYNTLFFVKPDYTETVTIDWRGGTGWGGQKAYVTLYYTKK